MQLIDLGNDWIINKSEYFDILEKHKCLCEGDPELSMTRNCRVHCIIKYTKRKLPTPPCSSLNSDVIRISRVMKFHYPAFSTNRATERMFKLDLLNLIYLTFS